MNKKPPCTHRHTYTQARSERSFSVYTCGHMLPVLPVSTLPSCGAEVAAPSSIPWCEALYRNSHKPRSQMRARGSVLAPGYSDRGWWRRHNQLPSLKALATQLSGIRDLQAFEGPSSVPAGSGLTCPPLGRPPSSPGSSSSRSSQMRLAQWATCSAG